MPELGDSRPHLTLSFCCIFTPPGAAFLGPLRLSDAAIMLAYWYPAAPIEWYELRAVPGCFALALPLECLFLGISTFSVAAPMFPSQMERAAGGRESCARQLLALPLQSPFLAQLPPDH